LTARAPRWLLPAVLGAVIVGAVAAYVLGTSSDDQDDAPIAVTTTESTHSALSGKPAADCSKSAARDAVVDSEFEAAVRELGVVPADDPLFGGSGYFVVEVICSDLTGGGAEEMIARLDCCAGGAPTPWAIFVAERGAWETAFYRTGLQASLSVERGAVVERSPAYAAGEPTCCPTTGRVGRVSWNGSGFRFGSDEASTGRRIGIGSRGVTRIGGFRPQSQSPVEAAKEFGLPSYVGPNGELCVNEWRDLGLRINFASLSGADPCSASGRVGSIELKDELAAQAGWETDQGIRVGMPIRELREIYPDARTQSFPVLGRVLVLVERRALIGVTAPNPVLSARIADGTVDELRMSVGAAGE
jgi:hypothetical protein